MPAKTTEITVDCLVRTRWAYGNEGCGPSTTTFFFNPNGRIEGYLHPNEVSWKLEGNSLKIFDLEGYLSWIFERQDENGEITLLGIYQRDATHTQKQVLKAAQTRPRSYRIASLHEIERELGQDRVRLMHRDTPMILEVPLCMGDCSTLLSETAAVDVRHVKERLEIPGYELWELKQAIVYTRHGLIIMGHFIVSESLPHFPFHFFPEMIKNGNEIILPEIILRAHKSSLYYGTNGNLDNYFHFFFELVSRFSSAFLGKLKAIEELAIVVPALRLRYQIELLMHALNGENSGFPLVVLDGAEAVSAETLYLPRPFPADCLFPNNITRPFVAEFIQKASPPPNEGEDQGAKKIYISRRDTQNRVLENEALVEYALSQIGFVVVSLSDMSVLDQIKLFRSVHFIVAPHGAGLTNLVFCTPGTKVIELQMAANPIWLFRRICRIFNLKYDFVAGAPKDCGEQSSIHSQRYTIEMTELLHAISAMSEPED